LIHPPWRLFCREKRQENFVEILGGDSLSGVLKGDFNNVALSSPGIDVARSSGDGQLSAVRHGIKRVRGEVPKHLPHLVLVHLGREHTPGQ
jgi:hypothetical protein